VLCFAKNGIITLLVNPQKDALRLRFSAQKGFEVRRFENHIRETVSSIKIVIISSIVYKLTKTSHLPPHLHTGFFFIVIIIFLN